MFNDYELEFWNQGFIRQFLFKKPTRVMIYAFNLRAHYHETPRDYIRYQVLVDPGIPTEYRE